MLLDVPDAAELAEEIKQLLTPQPKGPPPEPPDPSKAAQADLNSAKADGQRIDNMARGYQLSSLIHGAVPAFAMPPQEAMPPGAPMGA
jgi:hypothetical protein